MSFMNKIKKITLQKILIRLASLINNCKSKITTMNYSRKHKLSNDLKIFSHMTIEERIALHRLIKSLNRSIVYAEIGSYLGASSAIAAHAASEGSRIYCIDTWGNHSMSYICEDTDSQERDTYLEFSENIKKYADKIVPLRGWSYDMHTVLREQISKLDILLIDGDHNYEGVRKDWDLYSRMLRPGGFIAFHDVGWADGVKRLIDEEVSEAKYYLYEALPNLKIFQVK